MNQIKLNIHRCRGDSLNCSKDEFYYIHIFLCIHIIVIFLLLSDLIKKWKRRGKKTFRKKFKDTHREKTPLNKTPVLTKSMNMDI